ncbi:MAG: hypothetical protein ABIP79_02215 [Chitinophagaceae bacterium]
MHTINLMEFADYEYKDLYAYLMLQNETVFRITMPKDVTASKADKVMIVTEYYDALYFGQKLSELSHDFCYNVPSEYSESPFAYELSTADMEKLAEIMFYLIRGIVLDSETTNVMEKYWDDKEEFWAQYCNDEIVPVCQGLLHIMENNLNE